MKTRKILDISNNIMLEVKGEAVLLTIVSATMDYEEKLTLEDLRELRDWLTNEVLQDKPQTIIIAPEGSHTRSGPNDGYEHLPLNAATGVAGPVIATKEILDAQKSAKLEDRRAISLGPTELKNYPQLSSVITKVDQFQVHDMSSQVGAKSTEAFSKEGLKKGDA